MTPVIPCSSGSVTLLTKANFIQRRRDNKIAKYKVSSSSSRILFSNQRFLTPQTVSLGLVQKQWSGCRSKRVSGIQFVAAVGTDIATEDSSPAISEELVDTPSEILSSPADTKTNESSSSTISQSKRSRPARRSDMPRVKNEELLPGASFAGKVRSVQPFGAFIDFGAFTDGLVHVSQLSNEFVKDVGSVVSVGQEVKVRIVEANIETRRISLTMRDGDDINTSQKKQDGGRNNMRSKNRRDGAQRNSKFVKGQVLDGTVKNITKYGAFLSLPDGEEGFLPLSEETEFGGLLGTSTLQVGQEVNVRVLRISRGQATLTMKDEEEIEAINKKFNQGVVHSATNPFVLAFRNNKDIAAFLDERDIAQESDDAKLEITETNGAEVTSASDDEKVDENPQNQSDQLEMQSSEETDGAEVTNASVDEPENVLQSSGSNEGSFEPMNLEEKSSSYETETEKPEYLIPQAKDDPDASSDLLVSQEIDSSSDPVAPEASVATEVEEAVDTETAVETKYESEKIETGVVPEEAVDTETLGSVVDEIVEDKVSADTKLSEISDMEVTEDAVSDVQSSNIQGNSATASISPALVKRLREETGAGMMDCKNALAETSGDLEKAQEFLRKKGLAGADKKASRATAEGRIGSYIHDNRIGVLIEVNCETDFVSRGDIFKELVDDLAMQVAACPQVQHLNVEDVPEAIVTKERDLEMQKEDLLKKPESIRSKIVDGRIRKRLEELALLEQSYIKNDKMVVNDFIKQTIAAIGENIKVKRFVRYNLGEGLQKKSTDFAAEVAAQTTAKEPSAAPKDQPSETEPVEKPPTVAVSADLVKELREETGAGMMDCKKALSETGGDLEKAQEYLRKKGLSSADKKSTRIAAEGRIATYIHDNRIGALIEVNSETDFVARNERFKQLVEDLAMQVVACPQVNFVSMEEISEDVLKKEKEIEMQREDLQSKPESMREKIVEGRVSKRLGELALLEQPFIKDDKLLVKDLVKQTVAALGENIKIRRFVRFTLGE